MRTFLSRHQNMLIVLGLAILTLGVFWRVTGHGFLNYDDGVYVAENPHVLSGLSVRNIAWAFTTFRAGNWHPLTWISLMLDAAIFGQSPFGFHLTNLLLHIANVLLLFLVLLGMTKSPWRSAFVAALFAVHPLHVESVAWMPERKDVLSTFFGLLAVIAYVRYARKPSVGKYMPIVLLYALSLMAKPMLVTLPILLLLLDYWPLGRPQTADHRQQRRPGKLVLEKAPLFALSAASGAVAYVAQHSQGAMANLDRIPMGLRVENALVSYAVYLIKLVYPARLAVFYPYPSALLMWEIVGSAAMLVLVTLMALRTARTRPYLAVGWLWYLVSLLPVIGLVQVGAQAMADRYTYVPLIGVFVMIAWGIPELLGKGQRAKGGKGEAERSTFNAQRSTSKGKGSPDPKSEIRNPHSPSTQHPTPNTTMLPLAVASMVAVVVLAAMAYRQAGYWRDSETLFTHALEVTADNYLAHNNLGVAAFQEGDIETAHEHFAEAVRIKPDHAPARSGLGTALMQMGHSDEAIEHLTAAVRLDNNLAEAHNSLGILLAGRGRQEEAVAHYMQALRIEPENPDTHYNLALTLTALGRLSDAAEQYSEALRLRPDDAQAHNNLGIVLTRMGRRDDAVNEFKAALEIDPAYTDVQDNMRKALGGK